MQVVIVVFVTALMIAFNALYVFAEFGTVSARRTRISQLAEDGNRFAQMLLPVLGNAKRLDTYVAASQLGITASSLVLGYYGQTALANLLAPLLVGLGGMQAATAQIVAVVIVLIVLTTFQVLLGELVPKSVALRYPERVALAVALPMRWSSALFRPAIALFNGTATLILRLLGVPPAGHNAHVHSPEEIELLVAESAKGGLLDSDERQLLQNAFRVGELSAEEVMVPRTRLVAAPVSASIDKLLAIAASSGYTRIPLYDGSIDHVLGIAHLKDLFRLHVEGQTDARAALRSVPYVPWAKPAIEVWNQLRQERSYVAIVFDEFGGTAGMITFEDLLEEIFGELQDEHDEEVDLATTGPDGDLLLAGEVNISQINERFNLELPTDTANTIGGLIMGVLGRLPEAGDAVEVGGATLRVETVDGIRVGRVRLVLPPADPSGTGGDAI